MFIVTEYAALSSILKVLKNTILNHHRNTSILNIRPAEPRFIIFENTVEAICSGSTLVFHSACKNILITGML